MAKSSSVKIAPIPINLPLKVQVNASAMLESTRSRVSSWLTLDENIRNLQMAVDEHREQLEKEEEALEYLKRVRATNKRRSK